MKSAFSPLSKSNLSLYKKANPVSVDPGVVRYKEILKMTDLSAQRTALEDYKDELVEKMESAVPPIPYARSSMYLRIKSTLEDLDHPTPSFSTPTFGSN